MHKRMNSICRINKAIKQNREYREKPTNHISIIPMKFKILNLATGSKFANNEMGSSNLQQKHQKTKKKKNKEMERSYISHARKEIDEETPRIRPNSSLNRYPLFTFVADFELSRLEHKRPLFYGWEERRQKVSRRQNGSG